MGSTRIKGTKLKLDLGTTPGPKDYWADLTAYKLAGSDADKDVTTFEDAMGGGGKAYKLSGTGVQSTDETSFWSFVYDNVGAEVPFTLAPHGNTEPSKAKPHFTGTVKIGVRPDLGGEAGEGAFTFDFEWDVIGPYVRDTGII